MDLERNVLASAMKSNDRTLHEFLPQFFAENNWISPFSKRDSSTLSILSNWDDGHHGTVL